MSAAPTATGAYACPFDGCEFTTTATEPRRRQRDELMEHCSDECDLWAKVFNGEVVIR